jgi:transcriptional regulator with XRE-family HTH domain
VTHDRAAAARAVDAALAARGWTASDLMRETGLDPGTVGDFLNGQRWPQAPTRGKIEKALGWPYGRIKQIADGIDVDDDEVSTSHMTTAADIAELLANDPSLDDESREHITNQYRYLQELTRMRSGQSPDHTGPGPHVRRSYPSDAQDDAVRDRQS